MNLDGTLLLQHLFGLKLEEGCAYIQEHIEELTEYSAFGSLVADEALAQLYNPFVSIKLAELLIFFGVSAHHTLSHALGLKAKGDALVQIGHYQAALESLDAAGQEFLSLEDEGNWARSRISWIVAASWLGRVEEALQEAEHAHDVFLRSGEYYWACVIDDNTAVIYAETGRYQDALKMYEHLLAIYPTLTDQSKTFIERSIAIAEINRAIILSWLGAFDQAYRLQQQALARFVALQETGLIIYVEINLAIWDHTQGYYGSALQRYYQARDNVIQNNVHDLILLAELKIGMANCLVKLNKTQEACQLMNEAVGVYRQGGTSLQASNALREYATTLIASGRLQEALTILDEASVLLHQRGFSNYVTAIRLQQAELLLKMGSATQAYEEASAARAFFEDQGLIARSVRASLVMVGSLLHQAQQAERQPEKEQQDSFTQKAMVLCRQITQQAHQHHLQEEVYKNQHLLGRLFALQGDVTKAAKHYRAALAQIERILDDLVLDFSSSFLYTTWSVYEDMIALCLQQRQPERAFSYLERARSIALRQYLNRPETWSGKRKKQGGLRDSSSVLQANSTMILRTQHEFKEWQEKYHRYSILLTHMDTSVSPTVERGIIQAELRRCEEKLNELFERLYLYQATIQFKPQVKKSKKRSATPLDVVQLHRHLSSDQLLLAYFLEKERLVIFAVTKEQFVTYESPDGMRQLEYLLPLLHAHIQRGSWLTSKHSPQQGIYHMLNKLYQLLIAPVAALLPPSNGKLTIVPYGVLHTLPFHALYKGSRFLIEDFQINYLPACNLLTQLDTRGSEQVAYEERVMTEGRATGTSQLPLIFGYSNHGHLQRALEEAKALAAMLGGRCYLEEDATIARLAEQAPGSPIIHLATHGQSRLDTPNFSSVLLADGRFNAIDAFGLDLKGCELVTLSGCETGLALSSGGDEQLGLGRAFLAAGVGALVMSLWPVEDNATNELMQNFYQNLLSGESKAQALRTAQCTFIHQSTSIYSHPYYWAAFRLVGNASPLKYRRTEVYPFGYESDTKKSDS